MIKTAIFQSPFGNILLRADSNYLLEVDFTQSQKTSCHLNPILKESILQLEYYFKGKLFSFSLPLKINNYSTFEQKVFCALQKIPYGATKSYKEIAQIIMHPKSYRAVGNANAKNPYPIIIPCHRVIKANGNIGGYNGEDSHFIKESLITMEKNFLRKFL